jgi:hypothetical protein
LFHSICALRQLEAAYRELIGQNLLAFGTQFLMKIAALLAAKRRRPALRPIHLNVLTSWNIFQAHILFSLSSVWLRCA